jgi:uncharacterized protein YodC (DUF2158 family)
MCETQLQIGDTVVLKSGGPVMTVSHMTMLTSDDPHCTCVWFDDDSHNHTAVFTVAALRKANNQDY